MEELEKLLKMLIEEDKLQQENIESDDISNNTLYDAVTNAFADIEINLQTAHFYRFEEYTPVNAKKIKPFQNYLSFKLESYLPVLDEINNNIDELNDEMDFDRQELQQFQIEAKKTKALIEKMTSTFDKAKIYFEFGDSVADFERKNTKNKTYLNLTDEEKIKAKDAVDSHIHLWKMDVTRYELEKELQEPVEDAFRCASSLTVELEKNLDFITQLQSDKTNQIIPTENVDSMLIDVLEGVTTRNKALKELKKLKEQIKEQTYKASTISHNTENQKINKTIDDNNSDVQIDHTNTDELDCSFFKERGISNANLKQLRANKNQYFTAKNFVLSLDKIFSDAGIETKEVTTLLTKNQKLLFEDKLTMQQYLNLNETLYEIINPQKVSGILPSKNSALYSSSKAIQELVEKEQSKKKEIVVEGLELITNEKHKETFLNRLNCDSSRDERIMKYKSRRKNDKTLLYKKLSEEFGEGNYMKAKMSQGIGSRIVYKILHEEQKITATIVYYASTHKEHVNGYIPKD